MEIWKTPEGGAEDVRESVAARARSLELAYDRGARFLALPTADTMESIKWILACFHSPITVVPIPAELPPVALEQRLSQLPAGSIVFPEQIHIPSEQAHALAPRKPTDTWAVIFTSGTSGQPKGVALTGVALRASALAHAKHLGAPLAPWLLNMPLFHVGGLSVLSRAFFLGSPIALSGPRFHLENTLSWIRSGKIQGLSLVPTTLYRLIDSAAIDFSALKVILLGGAPSPRELVEAAMDRQAPIHLTYGMTEHASQIATEKSPGGGLEPLPGVEIQTSKDGELLIRSPSLASGFFHEGRFSALPLRDGFFPTGDLGALEAGRLLVRGRKSELIITGGKKVFPEEIEAALRELPGQVDCAVFAEPNSEWGELICAVIVEKNKGSFSIPKAKEALSLSLEGYKIPKRWIFLPQIPRTDSGKIQRQALRDSALQANYSQS